MDENMNKKVTSQELDSREIEVLDDGSVRVTEVIRTIYEQPYREFLTDIRNMQKYREQIEDTLKEDFREKQIDRAEKLSDEIDKLQPYLKESEEKYVARQEELRVKGIADRLKEELSKPKNEVNLNYVAAVWDNVHKNEQSVLSHLSESEVQKFNKYRLSVRKKG